MHLEIHREPKLAAFDLDGTLAESKQPLERDMGALLARLMQKMPVAVMSGGSFAQFQKQFLSGMPNGAAFKNLYIFPTNAAYCYSFKESEWKPLYRNDLTSEEKSAILAALDSALLNNGLGEPPKEVWGERIEDRGSQISFSPLGQQAPVDAKQAWHDEHDDVRRAVHAALTAALPDFSISMGGLTTIDITRHGIDKAYGVRKLAEITGIAIADILYIGDALWDGGNDSVVKTTGVPTLQVASPAETADAIRTIINS